jgi:beta-lactamase class A
LTRINNLDLNVKGISNIAFRTLALTIIFFVCCGINQPFAQNTELKQKLDEIILAANGEIGVAIMEMGSGEQYFSRETQKFPMQSVFKFPLAMAVLDLVDKGNLALDQKIHISKADLHPKTWSPVREKYPEGNIDLTIAELISYTVSHSDNNTCDILFRLVGGPAKVDKYIKNLGVNDIAIVATELEMSKHWDVQFTNWCRPPAMLQFLEVFYKGKTLSKSSSAFLWKVMTETSTGPKQIKGLLPKDVSVAHKTGSSGTNEKGITAATNDVGIIKLANGKHLAVVLFVGNSPDSKDARDDLMARISRTAYDYYSSK